MEPEIIEDSPRRIWIVRGFQAVFILCCLAIIALFLAPVVGFLLYPFGDDRPTEMINVSAAEARRQLPQIWPEDVETSDVTAIDYKSHFARDSYSTWYRINISERAATAWADNLHAYEAAWARKLAKLDYSPEGITRMISGPIPLRRQTGTTPAWWSPPMMDCRTTEVMVWYKGGDSGTARATYTFFDGSNQTLWIYVYCAQHDRMWNRGQLPDGTPLVIPSR